MPLPLLPGTSPVRATGSSTEGQNGQHPTSTDDIDELVAIIQAAGWQRIGVDGVPGSGKTHLARRLSDTFQLPLVDLDAFLPGGESGFVDYIIASGLGAVVGKRGAVIAIGSCLRDVLSTSQIEIDAHIYVKRMIPSGWADEHSCVFPLGVEVQIKAQRHAMAMMVDGEGTVPALIIEVMRYHDRVRPHDRADVVFMRDDS